jgi:hypothetical protein
MDFMFMVLARVLEAIFVVGMFGSFLVLLVSFVEDAETLFDMEDPSH